MFDAKSILEQMMTGGRSGTSGGTPGGSQPGQGLPGGLGDILGQVMNQGGSGQAGGANALEDLVRNMMGGGANPQTGGGQAPAPGVTERPAQQGGGDFGGLGDMMQDMLGGGQQGGQSGGAGSSGPAGGLGDILGNAFGQAKEGVREGAGRIDNATGASDALGDLVRQMSGKNPDEVMAQIQDLIANNKLGAGAALGGLGALVLGTQTGRSVAMTAAKVGAVALIGGLAYKAYQNYRNGQPVDASTHVEPEAAPTGTGFEPEAVSNDDAALFIRTMLAAAAADGRVDASEQDRILGSLKDAGLDAGAEEFIAEAMNNPASIDDIVAAVSNQEQAVRVYTAARLAVEPDTYGEKAFLNELATRLNIEPELAQHIDAAAQTAAQA